ncbi:hypothetical protein [Halococcoides cellulosivorans]|uniref:YkgJ family cysteine cluster protein n=1 Tax=Halococcoides cellulosivorans TaxID=1679096 RepID=A0A2R4WZ99_9EURY|nr:hypothetical protein [Halococcoides cellulosivorans]AWB26873.1 hypothetical protein HARCEL1_03650 [Halococcoides cellulosivorans]
MHRREVHPGRWAVLEFDPQRRFRCVEECTWCCHHGVMLYERDVFELADHDDLSAATEQIGGQSFVEREPKDRETHVAEDGCACRYLRDDGLCTLQLSGETDWKPVRCRVFPLAVERDGEVLRVSLREEAEDHCEGLDVGDPIDDHLADLLPAALWDLDDPDTHRELDL